MVADGTLTQGVVGGLLANDTGTAIVVLGISTPPAGSIHVDPLGSFVYTPVSGYSGPDSFTYVITDEYSRTSSATVTFTVDPVALDVTGSGSGPGAIHVTPATPIGVGPFTYHLVTTPPIADGAATIDVSTGVITFTPAIGFQGAVPIFTYDVADAHADVSAAASITLSVGTPAPPVTEALSGVTPANHSITVTPATPTGAGPFTFAIAAAPAAADGVATIDATTGAITFTPAHDFSGVVPAFTYTATRRVRPGLRTGNRCHRRDATGETRRGHRAAGRTDHSPAGRAGRDRSVHLRHRSRLPAPRGRRHSDHQPDHRGSHVHARGRVSPGRSSSNTRSPMRPDWSRRRRR